MGKTQKKEKEDERRIGCSERKINRTPSSNGNH
jgi:hypothetical protein